MRVPIAPSDLIPNRGFKLIARALQQNWPAPSPIALMVSQEVLSRALGYRDYHDLSREAEAGNSSTAIPTQAEVADSINTAVFAFLNRDPGAEISSDDVSAAVEFLPLNQLKVFTDAPAPAPSVRSHRRSLLSLDGQVPMEGQILWESVIRKGNLRDICLLGLMQITGLRRLEIVQSKVGYPDGNRHQVSHPVHKALGVAPTYVLVAQEMIGWLTKYIQKEGLQPGDYVFRSKRSPGRHMTPEELLRIVLKWRKEAQSIAAIRSYVSSSNLPDVAQYLMGHASPGVLKHYIQDQGMRSDE